MFVLVVLVGLFLIYDQNKRIHDDNVKMYNYLTCVSMCDIEYYINPTTKKIESNLFSSCTENCSSIIDKLNFSPNQLERGQLLFESDEYSTCIILLNSDGGDKFKNCLNENLPILKERYKI